jgi:hypothetical protein
MGLVILVNSLVVAIAVVIHYETLYRLTRTVPFMHVRHRFRIVVGVIGALLAHTMEVWVFATAYYLMHHDDAWGTLQGNFEGTIWDCGYFSFTVFTTLGFGDIEPVGNIRYLTGIEALTGLVLITWTASFLFFEMQRYWDSE